MIPRITSNPDAASQLAGVPDATVAHDYALTAVGCLPIAALFLAKMETEEAYRENREGAHNMFSSK